MERSLPIPKVQDSNPRKSEDFYERKILAPLHTTCLLHLVLSYQEEPHKTRKEVLDRMYMCKKKKIFCITFGFVQHLLLKFCENGLLTHCYFHTLTSHRSCVTDYRIYRIRLYITCAVRRDAQNIWNVSSPNLARTEQKGGSQKNYTLPSCVLIVVGDPFGCKVVQNGSSVVLLAFD